MKIPILEGIESGAWWFYFKLGFRPRDPAIVALASRQTERMSRRASHRSGPRVLERLASRSTWVERCQNRCEPTAFVEAPDGSIMSSTTGVSLTETDS